MDQPEFEQLVNMYYEGLYAFGLSLSHNRDEASELTQETFCRLAAKGNQLRDKSKARQWLFTTLYRIFLGWKRREVHLPHFEITSVNHELPTLTAKVAEEVDAALVLEALFQVDERYRSPLMLYFLEEHSYTEIAEILDIPVGTVMSRLSRGKEVLRQILSTNLIEPNNKIVTIDASTRNPKHESS